MPSKIPVPLARNDTRRKLFVSVSRFMAWKSLCGWVRDFREYWEEGSETLRGKIEAAIFWGGFLFLVIGVTKPDWLDGRISTAGVVVGIILVLVIPVVRYRRVRKEHQRTMDELAGKNAKSLKFTTGSMEGRASTVSLSYGQTCLWYRLEVTTEHPGGIKGCRPQLLRIRRGDKIMFDKEEALLTFAPGEQPDAIAKHIYPKAIFNLDVLYISEQNRINIAVYGRQWRYLPTSRLFPEHGIYNMEILVIGDDMEPIELTVLFNWSGFWTTSGLYLAN